MSSPAFRALNDPSGVRATVKFELLADLDDHPAGATVHFAGCEQGITHTLSNSLWITLEVDPVVAAADAQLAVAAFAGDLLADGFGRQS